MPIIAAASRSNDVARIAFPICVRVTKTREDEHQTTAPTTTMICEQRDVHEPTWSRLDRAPPFGECERVVAPEVGAEAASSAAFWRKNETPSARDQRRDSRRVAQRPVREALDADTEQAAAEHRRDEHEGEQRRRSASRARSGPAAQP